MIFARIKNNVVFDPQENETVDDYKKRFSASVLREWIDQGCLFEPVSINVSHGAFVIGDGNFRNPDGGVVFSDGKITYPPVEDEIEE